MSPSPDHSLRSGGWGFPGDDLDGLLSLAERAVELALYAGADAAECFGERRVEALYGPGRRPRLRAREGVAIRVSLGGGVRLASLSLTGSDQGDLARVRRAVEYATSTRARGVQRWPREFAPQPECLPSVETADPSILEASTGEGEPVLEELTHRLERVQAEAPTLLASAREVAVASDSGLSLGEVRTRSTALIRRASGRWSATLVRDGWSLSALVEGVESAARTLEEVGGLEWRPAAVWRSEISRILLTPAALTGLRDLLYPLLDPGLSPRIGAPTDSIKTGEEFSLVDDPTYPGGARRTFDDEGIPSRPVKVLDVLGLRPLLTLGDAQSRSARRTGSSVRPTYSSRPVAFPSNLILKPHGGAPGGCPGATGSVLRILEGAAVGGIEAARLEVGVSLAVIEGGQAALVGGIKLVSDLKTFFSGLRPAGREVGGSYGFYSPDLLIPAGAVRLE